MNATVWESALMIGMMLSPLACAGDVPPGWLARAVVGLQVTVRLEKPMQVLRTKTFSMPLPVFEARFEALEANAMNSPPVVTAVLVVEPKLMLGLSLIAFAGVTPSGVDMRLADGLHVTVVTPRQVSNM